MNELLNLELLDAAFAGSVKNVKSVFDRGLTSENANFWGKEAMRFAMERGYTDVMKLLLEKGFYTPNSGMYAAIYFNDRETLKKLLEDNTIARAQKALRFAEKMGKTEIVTLLHEYGAVSEEKEVEKGNPNNDFLIKSAKNGDDETVKALLNEEISEETLLAAVDAALENNHWETATILSNGKEYEEIDIRAECLKKMFLKASYTGDTEKVKFYLEKLIEHAVGVFTDETGKSTLEIAMENNPADIIKILSNYGFHENSLRHAYNCLMEKKK